MLVSVSWGWAQSAEPPPRLLLRPRAEEPQKADVQSFPAAWIPATPYPVGIDRFGYVDDSGVLYVVSGRTATGLTTAVSKSQQGAWTSLAPIPVPSEAPVAALIRERLYVASGAGAPSALHIYDVTSNTWLTGAPRPGVSSSYGAAVGQWSGKMYVVGGGSNGTTLLSIYDPDTNTWSAGPAAPATFQLGGYAQLGRFLYLVGTRTSIPAANSTVTMRLDLSTNTWSTGPTWTPARADFGMGAYGTRLFAMGGDNNGDGLNPSARVDELETSGWPGGTWVVSPNDLPSPRQGNRTSTSTRDILPFTSIRSIGGYSGARTDEHLTRGKASYLCQDYSVTQSTRAFEPASTDVGSHCDHCLTVIDFPFPFTYYGNAYTSVKADSNGNLQFKNNAVSMGSNTNLPTGTIGVEESVYPFWDDLRTDTAGSGIFTSTTGDAPNRIFTIEWRATAAQDAMRRTNFAVRFFEGSSDFEILYGDTVGQFDGTIGVQEYYTTYSTRVRSGVGMYTQFGPIGNVPAAGTRLLFTAGCCPPIAFTGAIGSNSSTYPGTSGSQSGRLNRDAVASTCGMAKAFPGFFGNVARTSDRYTFANNGPATCVTFSINTSCGANGVFAAAYLGSFTPGNVSTNYLGDIGDSPAPFGSFSVDVPANSNVVLVVNEVTAGAGCGGYDVVVTGLSCPLSLVSAASRKTHGTVDYDIPLPITGNSGLEGRASSANHRLVFTFNQPITSGSVALLTGMATLGPVSFSGSTMTVPISGVADKQKVVVGLNNVTSSVGQVLPNAGVAMYVLFGDVDGDLFVNSGDALQTRSRSGQSADGTNFRTDVNHDGVVNSGDSLIVRARSGSAVPR